MKKTIVIVGGVAGGASAAARLRRLNEHDTIILLEKGEHISFANCGLPYYLGDVITERSQLLIQTPESMTARFNLDVRTKSEAIALNHKQKQLTVLDLNKNQSYPLDYDILILAPGAKAIVPTIEGLSAECPSLFSLRSIQDTDRIKQFLTQNKPKEIAIVGAGFIGLEMAENLAHLGIKVTIFEATSQILAPLDSEMAAIVEAHLKQKGVTLFKNEKIVKITDNGRCIHTENGKQVATDMILMSIGVMPDTDWLQKYPFEFGLRKSLVVNEQLQTNLSDIYAVGDAIQVMDSVNGKPTYIPLAWPANRQGRLVADIINGCKVKYPGTQGTSIAKIFDLTVASTGNNEKTLKRLDIPYLTIHTHSGSHASYYPNASTISFKLLFSPTDGKLFGAQAVGQNGVDKRIDVLATAIKSGLTVEDLPSLELCYAPPYSSAKDPVNILGYVGSNILCGDVKTIQWHEIDTFVAQGGLLIDVRSPEEVQTGAIKGAINIPLPILRQKMAEIPKGKPLAITCKVGLRGYIAARILSQYDYDVVNLDGGMTTYQFGML